jgi:hypothetical protein
MIDTELQDFKLDEYKKEISLYKSYTEKLNHLRKSKESLRPPFLSAFVIFLFVLIFIALVSFAFAGDFEGIWPSLVIASLVSFLLQKMFYTDFFLNIFSFGKLNELKNEIKVLEELRSNSYSKLQPFERTIRNYFETQLKDFFEKNLYKKRSGNQQFEESLSEFSSMIEEVSNVNLITTRLFLSEYENYLIRRTIDHHFQSSKMTEKLDSIRSLVRNFSKTPTQKPKEIFAPERLYRTARKIDNWEEINKRRKMTGLKGEEIAVVIEQEFLESIGRKDLAQKVRHVSAEDGDGLGYDILSFFENGREKYIEVKSTTASLSSPFYLSRNELGFLKEHEEDAFIYRVLVSGDTPQIMSYSSIAFLQKNELIPVQYMVRVK